MFINEFTIHMPDYTVHGMSHELCTKHWTLKKKKKKNQPDTDVGSVKCASQMHPKVEIATKILIFMNVN